MNASPSDLLARHAPALEPPDPAIYAAIDRGLTHGRPKRAPRRRGRRVAYAVGAVAAATAVAFGAQSLLQPPQAATAVERLAETAGGQPEAFVPEGKYLYRVQISRPTTDEHPEEYPRRAETWMDSAGRTWVKELDIEQKQVEGIDTPFGRDDGPMDDPDYLEESMYPETADSLASDAAELEKTLLDRSAADPMNGALFEQLSVVLASPTSPKFNRMAILALGSAPNSTTTQSKDSTGRPCLMIKSNYIDPGNYGYMCFDESNALLLETGAGGPGGVEYLITMQEQKVVNDLPADVKKATAKAKAFNKADIAKIEAKRRKESGSKAP